MSTEPEQERDAYDIMVLRIIGHYSPTCTDYQLWRGVGWHPLGLKYPKSLYPAIERMLANGLITKCSHEGYQRQVYAITDLGRAALLAAES